MDATRGKELEEELKKIMSENIKIDTIKLTPDTILVFEDGIAIPAYHNGVLGFKIRKGAVVQAMNQITIEQFENGGVKL